MSQGKTLEQEAEEYADSLCPGYGARNQSWVRTRENFLAGAKAGEARGYRRGVEEAAKVAGDCWSFQDASDWAIHEMRHDRYCRCESREQKTQRMIRSLLAEGGKSEEK